MYWDSISENLKKNKKTIKEVAARYETTEKTVYNWLHGLTKLPVEVACDMADWLDISLDDLFGRDKQAADIAFIVRVYEGMNEDGKAFLFEQARMCLKNPRFQQELNISKEA